MQTVRVVPFLLVVLSILQCTAPRHSFTHYTVQKTATASRGMVVCAHPLAAEVGTAILQQGGNAVDAAIAVQFALAVVYPQAGNIGGGGFMVLRTANGEVNTLDFREMAPAAAHRDMYLDAAGNVIPDKSQYGALAAGVPGTVAGMVAAFEKYSQLKDWQRLVAPAVALAQNGFAITPQEAENLHDEKANFVKYNRHTPVFVKSNRWKAGDILVQKELAATLRAIQQQQNKGFYDGWVADNIVATMQNGNGIITKADLKAYKAIWRKPIQSRYKGYDIISMPPPSSGGIALHQLLKMVEPYPLQKMGFQSAATVHLMAEAERRVYADRATYLGDSDFYHVPVTQLMDSTYIAARMRDFQATKATPSTAIKAGVLPPKESEQTTHFSIVDAQGNAVSVTTTLNDSYGARTVVAGAGFILNNEMDDFSSKPGTPNLYGLIGGEANAIAPRKRMLSSMTPTIVVKDNRPVIVVGTPGGSTIITSVFQTILNVLEFGMTAAEAVTAPRFHHQWLPDELFVEEKAIQPLPRASLTSMGHTLRPRNAIGRVELIVIGKDGDLQGAADPRGDDSVSGY